MIDSVNNIIAKQGYSYSKPSQFYLLMILVFSVVHAQELTIDYSRPLPAMSHLTPLNIIRLTNETSKLHTPDSAEITLPPSNAPLRDTMCTIEIVPRCCVDSVMILIRHSDDKIDTIARQNKAPFRTKWGFGSLPDQDQIHLQIGYVLFHCNGKEIIAPPTPHRWLIDRSDRKHKERYIARKIVPPDTVVIDGHIDEWKSDRFDPFGNSGSFACRWSRDHLFFAIRIASRNVTPDEFVELHLDPLFTKTSFSNERHRHIRFAPPGISTVILSPENSDGSRITADSIAAVVTEDMRWRLLPDTLGYTLEISIPNYALSTRAFPRLQSGLDISYYRSDKDTIRFESWSGCGAFNRYNPSEWGKLVLQQSLLPLKFALGIGGILLMLLVVFIILKRLSSASREPELTPQEAALLDNQFLHIENTLEEALSDPLFSVTMLANRTGMEVPALTTIISNRFSGGFESFLDFYRLTKAKKLLKETDMDFDHLSRECGFTSPEAFTTAFVNHFKKTPENYRTMIKEIKLEEETGTNEYLTTTESTSNSGRYHGSKR